MLERVAREKSAVLAEKRSRLRKEALEQAEAAAFVVIATEDEKIVALGLQLSEALSRRSQAEHDVFGLNARLQHLGGVPRGTGDIAFSETRLVAEFLRTRQPGEASLGTRAWGPFPVSIPILNASRTVDAVVADDEANASA